MHLTVPCGVAGRLNLLTYNRMLRGFGALPEAVICYF
jgi:hypothetical protein